MLKEFYQVPAHCFSIVVDWRQRSGAVNDITGDDSDYLVRIAGDAGSADTVTGTVDGDIAAVRRVLRQISVVHAFKLFRLCNIDFDNYFFGTVNE